MDDTYALHSAPSSLVRGCVLGAAAAARCTVARVRNIEMPRDIQVVGFDFYHFENMYFRL